MPSDLRELTAEQRRIVVDATQLYDHYLDLMQRNRELRGGMFWKKVKGRDYLVRSIDRHGHVRSLGPGSHETEGVFREFAGKKRDVKSRLSSAADELRRRAKFCVAAGVNRVPTLNYREKTTRTRHRVCGSFYRARRASISGLVETGWHDETSADFRELGGELDGGRVFAHRADNLDSHRWTRAGAPQTPDPERHLLQIRVLPKRCLKRKLQYARGRN